MPVNAWMLTGRTGIETRNAVMHLSPCESRVLLPLLLGTKRVIKARTPRMSGDQGELAERRSSCPQDQSKEYRSKRISGR
jgi:hypothetical protein